MTSRTGNPAWNAGLAQTSGPCTGPLDAASEYLRYHVQRVLPMYVLAMAPHAVVAVLLIDAIVGEQRSRMSMYCAYLVICTIWRWIWLARLQYGVQRDSQEFGIANFWSRLAPVLHMRLFSHFAVTWGSVLAGVPIFYGAYLGSFAAPLLFENAEPPMRRLRRALSWIQNSGRRLLRIALAMSTVAAIMTIATFASQMILARTLIPDLLGINTADLNLTLESWAWRLRVFYFIFLVLDAFWAVASVFVYYDSQSRRMATDLRARLQVITDGSS